MLRPSDFPLPPEYKEAYTSSRRIFFEADVGKMQTAEVQADIMHFALAPAGSSLSQVLATDTYQQLASAFKQRGMNLSALERFRVGMVALTLQTVDLVNSGLSPEGVDAFYYQKAKQDNRPIGFLEPIQQQLRFLYAIGEGWEDEFIQLSLQELSDTPALIEQMISAWRSGNLEQIETLFIAEMQQNYPRAYETLLVQRNKNWLPKILAMFQEPGAEFVLVGTAHLAGDKGLLHRLKERGYTVSKL